MNKTTNRKYEYPRAALRACAEIIIAVTDVSKQASDVNAAELHDSIRARFDSVIRLCRVNSLPEDAARELLYPLAALVDETVLSIPQCRFYWSERPLQLRYFGEAAAGTKFFSRLETRMKAKEPNIEALELYFVGLALGVRGMHTERDHSGREKVFENLGIMLKNVRRRNKRARDAAYAPATVGGRWRKSHRIAAPAVYAGLSLLSIGVVWIFHTAARSSLLKFLDRF